MAQRRLQSSRLLLSYPQSCTPSVTVRLLPVDAGVLLSCLAFAPGVTTKHQSDLIHVAEYKANVRSAGIPALYFFFSPWRDSPSAPGPPHY
jgi:hypothetical protein